MGFGADWRHGRLHMHLAISGKGRDGCQLTVLRWWHDKDQWCFLMDGDWYFF